MFTILFRHTWPLWLYLLSPHHHSQGLEKGSLKNRFIGTWGTPWPSVKMFEGFFSFFFFGNSTQYGQISNIYCTHIIIKTTMMLYVHTVFSSGRKQSNLVLPSVSNTSKTIRHPQIWSGNKSLRLHNIAKHCIIGSDRVLLVVDFRIWSPLSQRPGSLLWQGSGTQGDGSLSSLLPFFTYWA